VYIRNPSAPAMVKKSEQIALISNSLFRPSLCVATSKEFQANESGIAKA